MNSDDGQRISRLFRGFLIVSLIIAWKHGATLVSRWALNSRDWLTLQRLRSCLSQVNRR